MSKLLTSEQWQATPEFSSSIILDHDGWRGTHDVCDYYTTPITKVDFERRKMESTCIWQRPAVKDT